MMAQAPTPQMCERMVSSLATSDWMTYLPVPTVGRNDSHWSDGKFFPVGSTDMWRGDVWPPTNYQVAYGLKTYGYSEMASLIADRSISNAIAKGVNERYQCDTGEPIGVPHLGMACTLLTMMLDGLSSEYTLSIRNPTL